MSKDDKAFQTPFWFCIRLFSALCSQPEPTTRLSHCRANLSHCGRNRGGFAQILVLWGTAAEGKGTLRSGWSWSEAGSAEWRKMGRQNLRRKIGLLLGSTVQYCQGCVQVCAAPKHYCFNNLSSFYLLQKSRRTLKRCMFALFCFLLLWILSQKKTAFSTSGSSLLINSQFALLTERHIHIPPPPPDKPPLRLRKANFLQVIWPFTQFHFT